jgi:hypothetical protein
MTNYGMETHEQEREEYKKAERALDLLKIHLKVCGLERSNMISIWVFVVAC